MRANYGMRNRQRGAVAVIMGIAAIALFAFMGIGVDLAYLYARKTELQNAADAAALAGAKVLNERLSGLTGTNGAINQAITTFDRNNTNNLVGSIFQITIANLRLGSCPNANDRLPLRSPNCPFVAASSVTSDVAAGGKTFLEVTTPAQTRDTFFMRVTGSANVSTDAYGYAVAGHYVNDVTPIGICAIDPAHKTSNYTYTGTTELLEAGFRRGVTYNLFKLNPLAGAPELPYLLNPVDAPPSACSTSHSSANFTAPFLCTGTSAAIPDGAISVYANTGFTASSAASLNSRFDDYSNPSVCDAASAPPDTNIKEYRCSPSGNPGCIESPPPGSPRDWMQPGSTALPSQESVDIIGRVPFYNLPPTPTPNPAGTSFLRYGVLWSYGPAYPADGSTPPKAGTTPFSTTNARNLALYDSDTALDIFDPAYPTTAGAGFPAGTPAAPYNQTSGTYFQAPSRPGVRNRRILNVVLVDCRSAPVGPPSCGLMTVVGVGKFFMQIPANFTGGPSDRHLMVEFAGLVPPVPTTGISLYR